jgi:hypothetical protein
MMHHLLSAVGLAMSGGIGLLAIGVTIVCFSHYKATAYWRALLLLTVSLVVFTIAHWVVLIWPSHSAAMDLLEALAYTGLLLVVYEFATIHPQISQNTGSDRL